MSMVKWIKALMKNPIIMWVKYILQKLCLEFRYRDKQLFIGYMSKISQCRFGAYNTVYEHVLLTEVELGDFSYIASGSSINRTIIGKFCAIGPGVRCGLGRHPSRGFVSIHPAFYSTIGQAQTTFADRSYFDEYYTTKIGNDVWIGANAVVVDGVSIGDGAIIGAGAVVTHDVPDYAIVGGVPAKVIRYRFEAEAIKELLEFGWWNKDEKWIRKNWQAWLDMNNFLSLIKMPQVEQE